MANLATINTNILADSGIDDINVIVSTGSYANPAWITALAWTKITGAPANIVTGTGTTNVVPKFIGTSTIGDSAISDNTNEVSITKRLFLNTGGQSFTITPNLSGVSNRIESSALPLEITTLGSALRLAAGGVTAQLTLASTGVVTLTNLAGTGSRIVTADASGNLSASSALSGYIQGTGTTNYLPKFTGTSTIGNSQVFDNGTNVGIGTASPQSKLSVGGNGYSGRAITAIANNADYAITFQQDNASGAGLQIFTTASTWGSFPLNISDGTSTQLRITAGGNLLVGTTTDNGARLQVSGTAQATKLVSASNAFAGTLDFGTGSFKGIMDYTASTGLWSLNNQTAGSSTTAYFQFQADSTPILTMLKSGNVGIGTTSPNGKLRIQNDNSTIPSLIVRDGGTPTANLIEATSNAYGNSFIVTATGNVGIGTTSPAEKLDVVGGGLAAGNGTIRTGITYSSLGLIGTFTNHDLGILTNGSIKATITSGGNVLIGTTSDNGNRLRVNGNSDFVGTMFVNTPSSGAGVTFRTTGNTNNPGIFFITDESTSKGTILVSGSTGALDMALGAGGTERVFIKGNSGNVLIGTTTDVGARLYVDGAFRTGTLTAGTQTAAVDWRLGNARGGTATANALIRVQINGVLVDLIGNYV